MDGISSYQADLLAAYNLLRIGKLVTLAHQIHGPMAAKVVEELASMGFSTTQDIVRAVQNSISPEVGDMNDSEAAIDREQIISVTKRLADDDFFARVRPYQFKIIHDARQDASEHLEKYPPAPDSKLKGKKAQEQHLAFVDTELEQRLDSHLSSDIISPALEIANATFSTVPDELYICINYSRMLKSTRNTILSQYATKTFGERIGQIADAALKGVALTTPLISPTSPNLAIQNQSLNLSHIILELHQPAPNYATGDGAHTNGFHHDVQITNGMAETNGENDDDEVHRSLESMAEGPFFFLSKGDEREWTIDKVKLRQFLVRQEILKIARQRVGLGGLRLLRILINRGRTDEKILQEIGLLAAKDMRALLSSLYTMGLIEVQEVPRDPQRQPNRTFFLWFYDEARAQKGCLEEIYKTMARLYQRLGFERDKMKETLDKVDKYDCHGREDEYMATAEVTLLEQYRRKERWLLGEIGRLDDSVALLSDL